ncbi:nucleoside-triphosphatase [bacterium]|nr:nucleoside-triphosphatase [bacterium]MBU1063938.1 nucleoside-triphosphatase [bacterium]MBU1633681.1 nucleoside-triphosphatase [bacterium]MBU1875008.1 nucleoside-triphosphatase [bacterium]
MIFLVTGEINEGKTRYMRSLYQELGEGDGFICPKVFENGEFQRYDIQRLSSNKSRPFACPIDALPANWDEQYRFGKYSFSSKAIHFAEQIINELIENKIEPIIIDEVGPLEIENHEGFYEVIKKVIDSGLSGFISVRKPMVDKFEKSFGIEPQIISKRCLWHTNFINSDSKIMR